MGGGSGAGCLLLVLRAAKGKELVSSNLTESGGKDLDHGAQDYRHKARIESKAGTWLWGRNKTQHSLQE